MSTVAAVALLAFVSAVTATPAATRPMLRVTGTKPLEVQGTSFRPRERVVVTALTLIGPKRTVVRATARGRFTVTFRLPDQPCGKAFGVRAVGSDGSLATLVVRARPCIPPPSR